MKIACIQQRAQGIGEYDSVFSNLLTLTEAAAGAGVDLIVQPEAAYPAYFLGIDEEMKKKALARSEEYVAAIAAVAKRRSVHIVAGVALPVDGDVYNAGIMFDDHGRELGRAYKSNMWHFDAQWFRPGSEYKAFDTRFGRMGIMVCADGRMPEIARILAQDGARIIIDLVNLTAAAARPEALMNQQYAFILPVRAMENGVWLLVADKAGLEAKTASYLGRSMVIDPSGVIVADASPDKQEILYYEIDANAPVAPLPSRNPGVYGPLVEKTEDLPVFANISSGIANISECETMLTAAQFSAPDMTGYIEKAGFFCHAAGFIGTRLLCLPMYCGREGVVDIAEALRPRLAKGAMALAGGRLGGGIGGVLFDRDGMRGEFYKTHGDGAHSDKGINVIETPFGKIAVLFGEEPYVPEAPRVAMLQGCDILVWMDDKPRTMNTKVMQTRAAENKIFAVRTNCTARGDCASVVNPDGAVMTSTFTGIEQAASALVFPPLARAKSVVPGTSVVVQRMGPTYSALL